MIVVLKRDEIAEIDKQDPMKEKDGGYQRLLVRFQKRINRQTGELELTVQDLKRIPMYAFNKSGGGWETQLVRAFGRVLGPTLGK